MINKEFSFKDFTGVDLTHLPASAFKGRIVGSCFAHENILGEVPKLHTVFPDGITSMFERCNLDNVMIPDSASIMACCVRRKLKAENDGGDWVQDEDFLPVEPSSVKLYEKIGMSIDPADIPDKPLEGKTSHMQQARIELTEGRI